MTPPGEMNQLPPPKPPGWYPDPYGQAPFRWWDGTNWSQQTSQGQSQQSQGGLRGWKLFLIITGAIVAAVVILVVGCSAVVSSSLDSSGDSGEASSTSDTLTKADLPAEAVLVKRARDKGENPDFGLDATFSPTSSRYYLIVESRPGAAIGYVGGNVSCQSADWGKSVNRDFDSLDQTGEESRFGTSFKLPKGWKSGWNCDLMAMGRANTDAGASTTVTTSLYRSR